MRHSILMQNKEPKKWCYNRSASVLQFPAPEPEGSTGHYAVLPMGFGWTLGKKKNKKTGWLWSLLQEGGHGTSALSTSVPVLPKLWAEQSCTMELRRLLLPAAPTAALGSFQPWALPKIHLLCIFLTWKRRCTVSEQDSVALPFQALLKTRKEVIGKYQTEIMLLDFTRCASGI